MLVLEQKIPHLTPEHQLWLPNISVNYVDNYFFLFLSPLIGISEYFHTNCNYPAVRKRPFYFFGLTLAKFSPCQQTRQLIKMASVSHNNNNNNMKKNGWQARYLCLSGPNATLWQIGKLDADYINKKKKKTEKEKGNPSRQLVLPIIWAH